MKLILATILLQSYLSAPSQVVMMKQPEDGTVIQGKFIVTLKGGVSLIKHQETFLDKFDSVNEDVKVHHHYALAEFNGYSVEVKDANLLSELKTHSDVEAVEEDRIVTVTATQQGAQWNLNRISQRDLPTGQTYTYNDEAGQGVDVYVIDTGIYYSHSEFGGRAKFGASFVSGLAQDDPNGHGTHVAGIVGGNTFGVAKQANLIGVQVLDASASGPWSAIIAGVNWAYKAAKSSKRPSVLNLSISGPKSTAVNQAINTCVKNGVHVVVAAGNNARQACEESPASAAYAITVGSTGNTDKISSFSNYGSCVDILAPGEQIMSAWTGNNFAAAWDSGTSMASPHVAGVKALLLSQKMTTTLATLDTILRSSATTNHISGLDKYSRNLLLFNQNAASQLVAEAVAASKDIEVEGTDVSHGNVPEDNDGDVPETDDASEDDEDDAPQIPEDAPEDDGDVPEDDSDVPEDDGEKEPASRLEFVVSHVQNFFDKLQ